MELRTHWATLTNFKESVHTSYPDVADLSWHDQRVLERPARAELLVVGSLCVIDGVVEPQCQLELGRSLQEMPRFIQMVQTRANVLQCVVRPPRLTIACYELLKYRWIRRLGIQFAP
jgi:hypothetical protein